MQGKSFCYFFKRKQGKGAVSAQLAKLVTRAVHCFRGRERIHLKDLGLFVGADDLAAVQDGVLEHPAGPQSSRAASAQGCCFVRGRTPAIGTGQPAEVEHHGIDSAGLYIL